MNLELDFSKCKTKEDVERVFKKNKKQLELVNKIMKGNSDL